MHNAKEYSGMKTIIAGSRNLLDLKLVYRAIAESEFNITYIIAGGAKGIDSLAIEYAIFMNMPYEIFPADWETFGKSAGYIRNIKMADNADSLIAIWDGVSKGTNHMINIANKKGLKIYVKDVK